MSGYGPDDEAEVSAVLDSMLAKRRAVREGGTSCDNSLKELYLEACLGSRGTSMMSDYERVRDELASLRTENTELMKTIVDVYTILDMKV